jgi:two-component system sensor histidine kinase/response regulator
MQSEHERKQLRALLIEDNPIDADLLQEALSDEGLPTVEVSWAQSLAEGLRYLDASRFDVVLLDLSLPDSHGIKTLEKLRCRAAYVPVVILSGLDDKEMALESMQKGAQDYLVKGRPSGESICRSMRYAIERSRAEELDKKLVLFDQREEFIAMLAHDLRSPLQGSNRMLSLMLSGSLGETPQWQIELLSKLKESNESVLLMINNVLEAYRLEAGDQDYTFTSVNVAKLLLSCSNEMAPLAKAKQLEVTSQVSEVPEISADFMAIKRIFINLLSNAVKFTPDGGHIELSISGRDKQVLFRITDSGVGITSEQQSHLLERFWQAEGKARHAGVGLGLYLISKLVDAHHGTVSCESTPGHGTTFEVCLPVSTNGSHAFAAIN